MDKLTFLCDVEEELQRGVILLMENIDKVNALNLKETSLSELVKYWILNTLEDMFLFRFERQRLGNMVDDVLQNILRCIHLDINKFRFPVTKQEAWFSFNKGTLTLQFS